MKVNEVKDLGNGHSIEVGQATWNDKQTSVRNRYETSSGGFSPRSSSEIPLNDIKEIIKVVSENDLLAPKVLAEMIKDISESIERQT